jgi:hypothetical protein
MAVTYEPLATTTLGSSTNSIVVMSSIPSTYTDLILVIDGEGAGGTSDIVFRYNGETAATNYSQKYIRADGSSYFSGAYSESYLNFASTWSSGRRYSHIMQIMNYSNTSTFKTTLSRTSYAGGDVAMAVTLWRATPAAINQITIKTTPNNMAAGTTFTLFGVKAA